MPSFRPGWAESSHTEVKGKMNTVAKFDHDTATDDLAAVLGTGFRLSLAE